MKATPNRHLGSETRKSHSHSDNGLNGFQVSLFEFQPSDQRIPPAITAVGMNVINASKPKKRRFEKQRES